jgi:hypothetical protein
MGVNRSNRFERQDGWIPRARFLQESVTVIGTGGIGRQVALQLVALGVPKLQLIDSAIVRASDVTAAGFRDEDISRPKVDMVGHQCHQMEPLLDLEAICERFQPRHKIGSSVFCCVDSDESRAFIRHTLGDRWTFWGDGRMCGDQVRVLVATADYGGSRYADSLSLPSLARNAGSPHVPSTIYAASLGAALLVHQYARHLQNLPLVSDATFDLSAGKYSQSAA